MRAYRVLDVPYSTWVPIGILATISCIYSYISIAISPRRGRIDISYLIQSLFKRVTREYFSLDRSCTVTKCIVSTKLGMCGIDCWFGVVFRMDGGGNAEGLQHLEVLYLSFGAHEGFLIGAYHIVKGCGSGRKRIPKELARRWINQGTAWLKLRCSSSGTPPFA